jgi:hypothetical protein
MGTEHPTAYSEGSSMGVTNVFVLGADDRNLERLRRLPGSDEIRYHALLPGDLLFDLDGLDIPARLAEARRALEEFDGSVDAIVGYWDFPVTSLVPILCRELDLAGPRLEGVLRCEHKYWSRLEQSRVIEDLPRFALVPLDGEDPEPPDEVDFPFWLKPVKAASSKMAHHVHNEDEFRRAVRDVESGIDAYSAPFDRVLEHADLPDEIASAQTRACIAEEPATGRQFTVEGYCIDDVPEVYGVVETVLYPGSSSFLRYEYPAAIPQEVADRMIDASERVMRQMSVGWSTFNIEYFWDEESDRIRLLEVNPRLSQAHSPLMELVDGVSNLHAMVEIGLGREPDVARRAGKFAVAGKFFPRVFRDGVVTLGADEEDIARVERDIPGVAAIVPAVEEGDRLSDLPEQEPYSYALAEIVIGAEDSDQLAARYDACLDALGLVIEEPDPGAASA